MLIVATQVKDIIDFCRSGKSNANAWEPVFFLKEGIRKEEATRAMAENFVKLKEKEALCVVAHGNDNEIGDEDQNGWGWNVEEIANLLADHVKVTPRFVVFESCADSLANFTTKVALKLETRQGGSGKLKGATLYGYNKGVTHPFPSPDQVPKNVDLQPAVVK